jgi:hypothetical protein
MKLPDDLISPQANPDIEVTLRAIRDDVDFLLSEKDPTTRRGCAMVLIAHLEHLVESEDPLPPGLMEGVVDVPADWLGGDLLGGRGLKGLSDRPFSRAVSSTDSYFIEFNGRLSRLFTDLPSDDRPFTGYAGPWVFVHRAEHVTATPTTFHLRGSEAFARVSGLLALHPGPPGSTGCRLMLDPRGYSRSRGAVPASLVLGAMEDLERARAAADELSAALGIRLLVATEVLRIDNH